MDEADRSFRDEFTGKPAKIHEASAVHPNGVQRCIRCGLRLNRPFSGSESVDWNQGAFVRVRMNGSNSQMWEGSQERQSGEVRCLDGLL